MGSSTIPPSAGIGFREPHAKEMRDAGGNVAWVEVHAENYMIPGGPRLKNLLKIRETKPISIHAVGTSLGGAEPLDEDHLYRLRHLVDIVEPGLVSEHLAWSGLGGTYLNDLLPLPYTEEALGIFSENVARLQERLNRRVLIENPAAYIAYAQTAIPETEFLEALCQNTGCGLLLDVNNVHVSARNLGFSATEYLKAFPGEFVGEFHLAGHTDIVIGDETVAFDDHGSAVADETWDLYQKTITRIGPRPTLIEWDNNLPSFALLLAEAQKANGHIASALGREGNAVHAA